MTPILATATWENSFQQRPCRMNNHKKCLFPVAPESFRCLCHRLRSTVSRFDGPLLRKTTSQPKYQNWRTTTFGSFCSRLIDRDCSTSIQAGPGYHEGGSSSVPTELIGLEAVFDCINRRHHFISHSIRRPRPGRRLDCEYDSICAALSVRALGQQCGLQAPAVQS